MKTIKTTIYFADIRRLAPFERELAFLLWPERREKMRRFRRDEDRLRCLAGGLFIEGIAQGRRITYNQNGKPFLPGGPWFSLSHSGNFACIALSAASPVGIDLEIRREENLDTLARTAFHPVELAFYLKKPSPERFFDIWTAKESYVKMLGTGFSVETSLFCILPENMTLLAGGGKHPCFLRFNRLEGYSLTLCTAEPADVHITEAFFNPKEGVPVLPPRS
ncbi:MAG: 4'-phosphopantetheinyl transferase superfamily protein [Treponema sp.]|jgi:4'-phosphopantetheinyl transferase|nr:4'-phosphopantetheinyl transferase superfamily protein [Treponema sp.]